MQLQEKDFNFFLSFSPSLRPIREWVRFWGPDVYYGFIYGHFGLKCPPYWGIPSLNLCPHHWLNKSTRGEISNFLFPGFILRSASLWIQWVRACQIAYCSEFHAQILGAAAIREIFYCPFFNSFLFSLYACSSTSPWMSMWFGPKRL